MPHSKTVVVIPAYQAEGSIGPLVGAIVGQQLPVIVVDDASTDATAALAQAQGAMVIRLKVNRGKGAALQGGFTQALKGPYDWVLTVDSDGQHLPAEIPQFLRAAQARDADLILGNRMSQPRGMPWIRRFTNGFMSWLLSQVIGRWVPDTQCGFRLISRKVLEKVTLTTHRFEIESELVIKAADAGFRIRSIPVSSVYAQHLSFIRPLRDTIRFLRFLSSIKRDTLSS